MSSSSSNTANTPFHNYPEKYPKARRKAEQLTQSIHALTKKGPRTLVATVVDTSFHITQGYVTCQTELGIVNVYGIPYGTIVPQMRVYCRQLGPAATNRQFIFDGFAQNAGRQGTTSGSFLYSTPFYGTLATGLATSQTASISAQSGQTGSFGYYWHCFFYTPQMPQNNSTMTFFEFVDATNSTSPTLALSLLPSGLLQFTSSDGHGFITTKPVPPHRIHWIVCQPGLTGLELLVDGQAFYTGILGIGDRPTFAGGTDLYTISLLGTTTGTNIPPLGTWVSKIGYGVSTANGSVVVPLPVATPLADSTIINQASNGLVTKLLVLCNDTPGSTTLQNSGVGATGSILTIATSYAQVSPLGPY